ncbi:folate family ECF transporter S component [Streptococcus uberis]|nr:folate family ECF transporter S component [Streptococcus uberis]MCK1202332.1 folate family ECF transporter S component [Streptococcus uberis]MCK1256506.1 folate family ECF transporter S component [Streptococcus uberis]
MPKQLYFPKLTIQRLVTLAMLIALAVIVSKFSVSIIPNQLVVSFTFIVNTVIGIIAGPFWSFITLAMIDLIDSLMGGTSHFIIWWTVMEAFQGLLYGFFFYKRPLRSNQKKDWIYVSAVTLVIMLFSTFLITPLLIQIYFHVPFWAQYAAGRWFKIFEIPLRVLLTMFLIPPLQRIPEIKKLSAL